MSAEATRILRRANDPMFVWIACHCGDRWCESTATTGLAVCINGHSSHFPTLHRAWLRTQSGITLRTPDVH